MESLVNAVTEELKPYPVERLAAIRRDLLARGQKVYDFGTGDPRLPTWDPIKKALSAALPDVSQYPTIGGSDELIDACWGYLGRRFSISRSDEMDLLPTRGSKEAIFHIALSIVGRANGRKRIVFPVPGYGVYRTSTLFAGGIPTPVELKPEDNYELQPWKLPRDVQEDCAAIWVNYPHNPTGATVDQAYWQQLIDWCHRNDTILLADDCYVDIYVDQGSSEQRPITALALSSDRVLSFMSLSKRSGLTGYRAGFIAGDRRILAEHRKARANFGLAQPVFIQAAAAVAWADDQHVEERRQIFSDRIRVAGEQLSAKGIEFQQPKATFYLWCRVPSSSGTDDTAYCEKMARKGVLCTPSTWMGGCAGWFRIALVPSVEEIKAGLSFLE